MATNKTPHTINPRERWPALMSRQVGASYMGISPTEFSVLIAEGKITGCALRPGGQPRYRRSDLDDLIDSLPAAAGTRPAALDAAMDKATA